ncbi:MAG: hypothetical protein Q8P05_05935 [Candidatus Diapherotrites archaeon]|nr:hypothetical protein [Candidatus Diapherotrites archaeon]MDZ4256688.1 hypothetical protein [archaeon]
MPSIPPTQTTPKPGTPPSIIEIIQNMVREGESEDAIIQTLNQLGVEPKKAQRLLLLAQADTFALLQNEINKLVKLDVEKEKEALKQFIQKETQTSMQAVGHQMFEQIKADLQSYENEVSKQRRTFETQTVDVVQKFTDLSERIRMRVNELGKDMQQVKVDQDEIKLRGIGTQNRLTSMLLLGVGLLFILADLYLFIVNFGATIAIDSVLIFIVMGMIGVTLMFVATLV